MAMYLLGRAFSSKHCMELVRSVGYKTVTDSKVDGIYSAPRWKRRCPGDCLTIVGVQTSRSISSTMVCWKSVSSNRTRCIWYSPVLIGTCLLQRRRGRSCPARRCLNPKLLRRWLNWQLRKDPRNSANQTDRPRTGMGAVSLWPSNAPGAFLEILWPGLNDAWRVERRTGGTEGRGLALRLVQIFGSKRRMMD